MLFSAACVAAVAGISLSVCATTTSRVTLTQVPKDEDIDEDWLTTPSQMLTKFPFYDQLFPTSSDFKLRTPTNDVLVRSPSLAELKNPPQHLRNLFRGF